MANVVKREAKGPLGLYNMVRSDGTVTSEYEVHYSPWLMKETWVINYVIVHDGFGGWTHAVIDFL